MQLGERINYIRKTNQMNQKEFADRIGVSQSTLSDIERGSCIPLAKPSLPLERPLNVI